MSKSPITAEIIICYATRDGTAMDLGDFRYEIRGLMGSPHHSSTMTNISPIPDNRIKRCFFLPWKGIVSYPNFAIALYLDQCPF